MGQMATYIKRCPSRHWVCGPLNGEVEPQFACGMCLLLPRQLTRVGWWGKIKDVTRLRRRRSFRVNVFRGACLVTGVTFIYLEGSGIAPLD